ncbi:MAG: hypothetical protein AB8B72_06080 [Crocinitomicaceae bacterium]
MKFILLIITFFATMHSFGQWTKGGTEKNYDQYRIIRDTIVSIEKIKIPIKNTSYRYASIGSVLSMNSYLRSLPLPNQMINGQGYMGEVFSSGKMGISSGMSFSLGGIRQIQQINEKLIERVDVGFAWDLNFSSMKCSLDEVRFSSAFNDLYKDFLAAYGDTKFRMMSWRFGPSVTLTPDPKSDLVRLDVFLKTGITGIFSGINDYVYASYTDFESDLEYQSTVNYSRQSTFTAPFQFGFNVRFKDRLFVGLEINKRLISTSTVTEDISITIYETNTFQSFEAQEYGVYNNVADLGNITLNIGFTFGTK